MKYQAETVVPSKRLIVFVKAKLTRFSIRSYIIEIEKEENEEFDSASLRLVCVCIECIHTHIHTIYIYIASRKRYKCVNDSADE